jgi:hypothetical protein
VDWKLSGPPSKFEHRGEEKVPASTGNRRSAVQPVASHFTDWAIPSLTCIPLNV